MSLHIQKLTILKSNSTIIDYLPTQDYDLKTCNAFLIAINFAKLEFSTPSGPKKISIRELVKSLNTLSEPAGSDSLIELRC